MNSVSHLPLLLSPTVLRASACVKQVRLERCRAGSHAPHDSLSLSHKTRRGDGGPVRSRCPRLSPPDSFLLLFVFHTLGARAHPSVGLSSNGSAGALPLPPAAPPRVPVPRQVPVALVVSPAAIGRSDG